MRAAIAAIVAGRRLGRRLLLAVAYLGAFVLLDWVSFIRPFQGANITPWSPQPALAIALLSRERRWVPLVCLGVLLAEVGIRGRPADWLMAVASAIALGLCYAAIARALHVRSAGSLFLATRRDLIRTTIVLAVGAAACGCIYVTTIGWSRAGWQGPFTEAVVRYWVGDAVGSIVVLPFLLALLDAQRRTELRDAAVQSQWWLIALSLAVVIGWTFGQADPTRNRYLYLLMVPVVWASATMGVAGAIILGALAQAGLIVAIHVVPSQDLTIFEMQALMTALVMTGLMLGVVVDEQRRTQAELRHSLHLVAAGQMSAALAHELNQPLTALATYATAARTIAGTGAASSDPRVEQLSALAERMADDAMRAGDIVRRLRDFFGTGGLALQRVGLRRLVSDAVDAQRRRAQASGVEIRQHSNSDETVWVDPVQIGVVLRNLLSNAMDAVSAIDAPRIVELHTERVAQEVVVEVADNGPGIGRDQLQSLFEPRQTSKPGGMGVGLGISRAIVDAHGGRLWAEPGPRGCLRFSLPVDGPHVRGGGHAL